jgi:hypothetical protein
MILILTQSSLAGTHGITLLIMCLQAAHGIRSILPTASGASRRPRSLQLVAVFLSGLCLQGLADARHHSVHDNSTDPAATATAAAA